MSTSKPASLLTLAVALIPLALLASACGGHNPMLDDLVANESAAEESNPLGGEALSQRKREMQRIYRDMVHFHTTLRGLEEHKDRSGTILFTQFLDAYMGTHLDPLLRSEWQSRHPEVMALDANLRFAKADVLIRMRAPGRAAYEIEQLERRYEGRDNMLVEYPIGGQGSLREGLELLRNKKWWRG